ncbi:MAG: lysozyme inhibitor LprI family protein, partial [Luteimonas sp.]|nr:lysozyme inhibitor LprI family protein [Luteimonas sp.]
MRRVASAARQARRIALAIVFAVATAVAPAQSHGPEAGFDCAKAQASIEHTICSNARMRWLDQSLSRAYRAALEAASDAAARDALRATQRHWLAERDRVYGPRKLFANHGGSSDELFEDYFRRGYVNRIAELRDIAAPALWVIPVQTLDDAALATARPGLSLEQDKRIYSAGALVADGSRVRAKFSPDAGLLAVLLHGRRGDGPDQAWIYRLQDRRFVAATPAAGSADGEPGTVESLEWQDDATVLVRVRDGASGRSRVFSATMDGFRELDGASALPRATPRAAAPRRVPPAPDSDG